MNSDLFTYRPTLSFEQNKLAGIELSENPQMWSREVLSELYRQVPEVADYTPKVMFMQVDEEQGYGLGCIVLANTTDSALAVTRTGTASKKVLIPVIVKGHELQPLDILMTSSGKMLPLNGTRLREALFRPETFEMVTEDSGDSSLWNLFYPPGRSDNTFGAGISQGSDGGTAGAVTMIQGPGMKLSADQRFELLEDVVGPSALKPDLEALASKLSSDEALLSAVVENAASSDAIRLLASFEATSASSAANAMKLAADSAKPSVIQLGFEPGEGYWVKVASREVFYHTNPTWMDRRDFLKFAGPEVTHKVDTQGTVTLSTQPVVDESVDPHASKWSVVEKPGIYKVRTLAGKDMTGWVLPNLLDLDGTRVPLAVFTNGAVASVQSQIAGAHVGTGIDLPSAPAKGPGIFYVAGQGGIEGTVPLMVLGSEAQMNGGDCYLVRTMTGHESKVCIVPGMSGMRALGGEFHVTPAVKFLPLDTEVAIQLIEEPADLAKTAAAVVDRSIHITGSGEGEYYFRFDNLPKLAGMFPRSLDSDQAMMVLCLAGLSAQSAVDKLASAEDGFVDVSGLVDVKTAHDAFGAMRKAASANAASIRQLRVDLVKEAAVLPDAMTVDAVLSLGFINSENVRMFISRLPYLEKALSMICELLLVARLGLTEIPEGATARAARGLDEAVRGLRALSLRKLEDDGLVSG
jgi:hypothetical protein